MIQRVMSFQSSQEKITRTVNRYPTNKHPNFLKDAIIAIEDERFETHPGIDIKGIMNAGIGYVQVLLQTIRMLPVAEVPLLSR